MRHRKRDREREREERRERKTGTYTESTREPACGVVPGVIAPPPLLMLCPIFCCERVRENA